MSHVVAGMRIVPKAQKFENLSPVFVTLWEGSRGVTLLEEMCGRLSGINLCLKLAFFYTLLGHVV